MRSNALPVKTNLGHILLFCALCLGDTSNADIKERTSPSKKDSMLDNIMTKLFSGLDDDNDLGMRNVSGCVKSFILCVYYCISAWLMLAAFTMCYFTCPCDEIQTVSHIVSSCPLTKLYGTLS